ncbi:hypothetical protein V7S43_018394 [Phytophthora oleae]|uniref:Cilia- and flagella-associated protein 157 n=1 Tax=Phytophthora oleae TaxID=2107226 RepID=A0ABD3EQK7_9STRA
MDLVTDNGVSVEGDSPRGENVGGKAPLTHSILSKAVLDAISATDSKLAFDMMLVNEHLKSQDAANHSLKEEVSFLKQTLAKQTKEQSEMFHYFHDKTDEHMARIAELETLLVEAQEEKEKVLVSSQESLMNEKSERAAEQTKAQDELAAVKEELRLVHAFAAAKREMEAYIRTLETKIDAQRAVFQTKMQDLERNNLLEQARTKQELLGRMQAAKAELMLRTNDQVASSTQRTLLENEHFTQELAFQSRETEKLIERLDESQQELAKLRAQNKVLESNEQLMAKKNRYYQKILAKLQTKTPDSDSIVHLQIRSPNENNEEDRKVTFSLPEHASGSGFEDEKRLEVERQLQRALEWLRVFQRERQFMLAQQDEVIQFLYRSLDEAAEARKGSMDKMATDTEDTGIFNKRVEELIQLAPATTTMDAFGRRVLVARPALDELSSEDAHEVLLFLLEKLHLYQVRIAAVYPNGSQSSGLSATSPVKQMLERQLGVELPPITNTSPSPSSIRQKRGVFSHVAAAVDAGNTEWLKSKAVVHPQPQPLNPQLLAMATNQFNFTGQTQKSPVKRRYQHSSIGKNPVVSPPRRMQTQIQPLIPWSKSEELMPWANTASAASITNWDPSNTS